MYKLHDNYSDIKELSKEAKEKLNRTKPTSFGQAARIPGVNSCDLSLIAVHVERKKKSANPDCDYIDPSL